MSLNRAAHRVGPRRAGGRYADTLRNRWKQAQIAAGERPGTARTRARLRQLEREVRESNDHERGVGSAIQVGAESGSRQARGRKATSSASPSRT